MLKMLENPLNLTMFCSSLIQNQGNKTEKRAGNLDELYLYNKMI